MGSRDRRKKKPPRKLRDTELLRLAKYDGWNLASLQYVAKELREKIDDATKELHIVRLAMKSLEAPNPMQVLADALAAEGHTLDEKSFNKAIGKLEADGYEIPK